MVHFYLGGRRFLSKSVVVVLLLILFASFIIHAQQAQGPRSMTTKVTATERGAEATSTEGEAGAGYHPSRVLVRFRAGVRDFLPGSSPAGSFPGEADLFLVPNPPGLSVSEV